MNGVIRPVIVAGNLVADVVAHPVDGVPRHESLHIDAVTFHVGGCAGNVAVGLAALGAPVRLVGAVGADRFADALLGAWGALGIDLAGVQQAAGLPTSVSIVLVDSAGERRFLHAHGANAALTVAALGPAMLAGAGWLHIGGFFAVPGMEDGSLPGLLREARGQGLVVSVDLTGEAARRKRALLPPLLPHTDLLLLNHDEGRKVTDERDPAAIAAALRSHGVATVVVKLGPEGCYWASAEGEAQIPTFPATVVDTTGAGDAFAAALIAARCQGDDWAAALRRANAAGAHCVTALGATAGWAGAWHESFAAWGVSAGPHPTDKNIPLAGERDVG